MPKAGFHSGQAPAHAFLEEAEARYVKIIVFDDQNRLLTVRNRNRFVLPGGRIEWDDDDAESAARREVFESANIALGPVHSVTVVKTKTAPTEGAQTIVFVGRMASEGAAWPGQGQARRFMSKETLFRASSGQSALVRSLIDAAYRILISGEIRNEHDETTAHGRERYNLLSML